MGARHVQGRPASSGFARGRLLHFERSVAPRTVTGTVEDETRALRTAIAQALGDLGRLQASTGGEAGEMLAFQSAMLDDPALSDGAFAAITQGTSADQAWTAALDAEIEGYRTSSDEYFRARAGDLQDLHDRVLAALTGATAPTIPPGVIVLANDMPPSVFLATSWTDGGIVLRHGSTTSHVAMLARSRRVPMIVGVGSALDAAPDAMVLLDGNAGSIVIEPVGADEVVFEGRRAAAYLEANAGAALIREPAVTADGRTISVLLNIADPAELDDLDPRVCDGIGLVRTELLFEGRALPDEDTQTAVYSRIARWAAGRPVTIRTLDAGGDKPIAGLTVEGESNPFLGVRGIRLSLRHPDVLKVQLRALARAATDGQIEIMIPMVSVPSELSDVRRILDVACAELAVEGRPCRRPPLGIMVEVPAVAIAPERFDADFYSIGSNDLVQYTLAAGRDVAALADIASAADPAVLRLIANVVHHGRLTIRKVSLCGDAGGDPTLIPELVTAGLTHLSMAPSQVALAKLAIRAIGRPRAGP